MIGGDPTKLEPYGYAHFAGRRGIVALRNPAIEPRSLKLEFAPARGLAPDAAGLVLERIYPSRWISPGCLRREIDGPVSRGLRDRNLRDLPLAEAREPLLAGAVFDSRRNEKGDLDIDVFEAGGGSRLINPDLVRDAMLDGRAADPARLEIAPRSLAPAVTAASLAEDPKTPGGLALRFKVEQAAVSATLGDSHHSRIGIAGERPSRARGVGRRCPQVARRGGRKKELGLAQARRRPGRLCAAASAIRARGANAMAWPCLRLADF